MEFVKKHKIGVITVGIVLLIIVLLLVFIGTLMPDTKKSSWGNRTKDIAKYPISDEVINKTTDTLKAHTSVTEVTYRLSGRKMIFTITVDTGVTRAKSESLVSDILENLSDDIKGYYDIEVNYKSVDSEDTTYPFMGYKNKISTK